VKDGPGATPLPITFLGLTIATTIYAGFETKVLPQADSHTIGWLVLALPVPLQFLPAVWGLIRGELAAATGSAVLAATWLALALATITGSPGAPGPSKAESLFLFASAAALVVSVATELVDRKLVAAVVMLTASARFALTGVSGSPTRRAGRLRPGSPASSSRASPSAAHSGSSCGARSAAADGVEVAHPAALGARLGVGIAARRRPALLARAVRHLALARRLDADERLGHLVDRVELPLGQPMEQTDLQRRRSLLRRVVEERRPLGRQRDALQHDL
jgi:hypothetical protein